MYAEPGFWVVVLGTSQSSRREGQIVEVLGAEGGPPYRVHWLDGDRLTLFFPGPDAQISREAPQLAAAHHTTNP